MGTLADMSKAELIMRVSELEGILDALLAESSSTDTSYITIFGDTYTKIMKHYDKERVNKIAGHR